MSSVSLTSLGTRAMAAAQAQLSVTGHNISNASVDGYSRQQANLATASAQYSGAGWFGRGVDVATVSRAVNGFLASEVNLTGATAAMDQKRADLLDQLQTVFRTGAEGLGSSITALNAAWTDVATNPDDLSARQVVLQRADDLAAAFRDASGQLDALQGQLGQEARIGADTVTQLAGQVAQLNHQIVVAAASGQPPNDLLDQRDQLIDQISQFVQVTRVEQSTTGAAQLPPGCQPVNLFVGGGQSLVVGTSAYTLSATQDPADPTKTQVQIGVGGQMQALSPAGLGGGTLAALMAFQDLDLAALRTRIDTLAAGVADSANQQQAKGLDLGGAVGTPLFDDGQGGTTGITAGTLRLALHDPRALAAASPVTAQASTQNQGTAAITAVSVATVPVAISTPTSLVFTNGSGAYEWRDAAGAVQASGTWSAGNAISYGGVDFQLSGQPKAGDRYTVSPTTAFTSSNGNALAMAQLGDAKLPDGSRINDGYAQLIADIGTRAKTAQSAASVSAGVAGQAKSQLTSQTGVNLDEEAAKLIQYQQSYQAAAKILQVAQKIFDTMLGVAAN